MARISRGGRKWFALAVWLLGLGVAAGLGIWNYNANGTDADNRLIGEATRSAGELAALLSQQKRLPDEALAHSLVEGALEDDRIYAVKITADGEMLAGERRNYMWEPIPWDDEIAEHSIQGMNSLKIYGKPVGKVEVWISTRSAKEEKAIYFVREIWRFAIFTGLWTGALLLLFWHWGVLRRWGRHFMHPKPEAAQEDPEKIILGLCACPAGEAPAQQAGVSNVREPVDAREGRKHQRIDPDAWFVTAGMFRQTFAKAPQLMSRLYADGEIAGLCHLGRMLEQAAPCVGAARLKKSANGMQKALNDPESDADALAVDECVAALEEVLTALCGKGLMRGGNLKGAVN